MELVAIVIVLALLQYTFFGALVGRARMKYHVHAPSISGHPVFERYYRVHQNTLESLILFIPGILLFATYVRPDVAAAVGVIFIIGRFIYLRAYVADPKTRSLGFLLTIGPSAVLALGGCIGALISIIRGL
jgi:glutathione S-transferase